MKTRKPRSPRRSRQEWKKLVDLADEQGLKAAAFCRQNDIAYASFIKWRSFFKHQRLQTPAASQSAFIELTAPTGSVQLPGQESGASDDWLVELSVGAHMVLRLKAAR